MSYRKTRSDQIILPHLAGGANHGKRILTLDDSDVLDTDVALSLDANGNVKTSGGAAAGLRVRRNSSLVGTRPQLNLIEGSNITLTVTDDSGDDEVDVTINSSSGSGTNRIKSDLNTEYDSTPGTTQTEDDEFNDTSLDAKWTVVTNTVSSVDIDTTYQSHLFTKYSGSGTEQYKIRQSYSNTGDFSLTISAFGNIFGNDSGTRILVDDGTDNEQVMSEYVYTASAYAIRLSTTTGGSFSAVASLADTRRGSIYLHLQRVSGTWSTWFSFRGIDWRRVGTSSKSITVSRIALHSFSTAGAGPFHAGWDWIRRDWITL